MPDKIIRIILCVLSAFIALTAIGGGIAMLIGADRFPVEWLQGTPFADYMLPALVLAVIVGGSALLAAGILLIGYVSVEALILKQTPPGPTWIEIMYWILGAVVAGLAALLWRNETRRQRMTA